MKLYKVLGLDGKPCHGGSGVWSLPHDDNPGDWMPVIKRVVPCVSGYHLCRPQDLINWLGESVYEAELAEGVKFVVIDDGSDSSKIVTGGAVRLVKLCSNWNEFTARLFAADCAEHKLKEYEKRYPTDNRVRDCIATARYFANGDATDDELSAAESAAWSAARSAARSAAWSAAESATWSAAESAAWSAARSAARSAAWSAAWSAARSAAWSAAESAARSAAWSAAWSAERAWQTERLIQYVEGQLP